MNREHLRHISFATENSCAVVFQSPAQASESVARSPPVERANSMVSASSTQSLHAFQIPGKMQWGRELWCEPGPALPQPIGLPQGSGNRSYGLVGLDRHQPQRVARRRMIADIGKLR
jgi:hypothetical protein